MFKPLNYQAQPLCRVKSRSRALLAPLLLLALPACGDPMEFGQDLDNPRVLGVQVESDDGHSWPAAGQAARVQLLLAGSDGPLQARAAYQVCFALETSSGVPLCGETTLADGITESAAIPEFAFTGEDQGDDEPRLAILGVACASGTPQLSDDPQDWSCSDDSAPLRFSFEATSKSLDIENPSLDETSVLLVDEPIAFQPPEEPASCDDAPEVTVGTTVVLDFTLDEAARSSSTDELLQISHFADQGRLERQFTIIDPDEELHFQLEFEAPDTAGPVKSYFVVRDDRGGTSWQSFSLCVVD